jgi:hypothetical protein
MKYKWQPVTICHRLNSPLLALAMLAGFLWLANESRHEEVGYSVSEFTVIQHVPRITKLQSDALQSLYNLTDKEIAHPRDLFGE